METLRPERTKERAQNGGSVALAGGRTKADPCKTLAPPNRTISGATRAYTIICSFRSTALCTGAFDMTLLPVLVNKCRDGKHQCFIIFRGEVKMIHGHVKWLEIIDGRDCHSLAGIGWLIVPPLRIKSDKSCCLVPSPYFPLFNPL